MPRVGEDVAVSLASLPTGGNVGDTVVKTSPTDYAASWGSSPLGWAAGTPVYASGMWQNNWAVRSASSTAITITLGRTYYVPVFLYTSWQISSVAVVSSTSSGSYTMNAGIVNMDPATGLPGTALYTSGTTTGSLSSGAARCDFPAVAPPAGWVFLGWNLTSGPTGIYGNSGVFRVPWSFSAAPTDAPPAHVEHSSSVVQASPGGASLTYTTVGFTVHYYVA